MPFGMHQRALGGRFEHLKEVLGRKKKKTLMEIFSDL
jgi:hypothetical protein